MRKRLKEKLSSAIPFSSLSQFYNSFDIVGDIAILKTPDGDFSNAQTVADKIMQVHKNVKTVFAQTGAFQGDFRVRELKFLAGEPKTRTRYKEAGCVFAVDVKECYFSPRLCFERSRIARLVNSGESIVNMFAGVGCFSIIIAKTVPQIKVFSIDLNPIAFHYMRENVVINKVEDKVSALLGDSKDIIQTRLQGMADRVLMPLPEKAVEYLPYAILALKKCGGWIHAYDFEHASGDEDPVEKTKIKLAEKFNSMGVGYVFGFSRVVRSTGPNWYQTVVDILVANSNIASKF